MKNLKFNNVYASLILNNENVKIETLCNQTLIIEYFNHNTITKTTNIYFNVCDTFIYNENDELIALKIVENTRDYYDNSKIVELNEIVIYVQQLTNNCRDMLNNFLYCNIEKYDENHEQSNEIIIENFEKLCDFFTNDETCFNHNDFQIYNTQNIVTYEHYKYLLQYVTRYKINANLFDINYASCEMYENKYQTYISIDANFDVEQIDVHFDLLTLSHDEKQIFVNICL